MLIVQLDSGLPLSLGDGDRKRLAPLITAYFWQAALASLLACRFWDLHFTMIVLLWLKKICLGKVSWCSISLRCKTTEAQPRKHDFRRTVLTARHRVRTPHVHLTTELKINDGSYLHYKDKSSDEFYIPNPILTKRPALYCCLCCWYKAIRTIYTRGPLY